MSLLDRIIITGGAGFIGSQLANFLIKNGHLASDILVVDDSHQYNSRKATSLLRKDGVKVLEWSELPAMLEKSAGKARVIFHMGAISNTEEKDKSKLDRQNVNYSKDLWNYCAKNSVPFFYASSASTYGAGEFGFDDDPSKIPQYKPLNLYAQSKQEFDLWVLQEISHNHKPEHWAGFKFFNVYGAGEEHKGSQKSVIWHAKNQFEKNGFMKLFKSHHPDYKDGEQARDFVYVGDVCKVLIHFYKTPSPNGVYNLGSGIARTFKDLVTATASALGVECKIEYIPTPEGLRAQYQYFTQATLDRLRGAGYKEPMTELEEGVRLAIEEEKETLVKLTSIYRHLVKGFNQESLQRSEVKTGGTLWGDRAFAFQFLDTEIAPSAEDAPWLHKMNLVVQHDWPDLARIVPAWNSTKQSLKLRVADSTQEIEEVVTKPEGREKLATFVHDFLKTLTPYPKARHPVAGPLRLIGNANFNTRYTDGETGPISLGLRETMKDLETKFKMPVDERRFRLNLFLEGAPAWSELKWAGKKLRIGNCVLQILKPIGRCPNIDVDQNTGRRLDEIFPQLKSTYGHSLTGMKADVLEGGELHVGDSWELFD